MVERNAYVSIFKFKEGYRLSSRESAWVEFKESFNWNSRDKYAKTMAAFANNRGGFIVFGVQNKPRELVGLSNYNFDDLDESRISEYFNSLFSPEIQFEKFDIEIKGKKVGFLFTRVCESKPVISIKNDNVLKESEIYYRYNGRTEKIKYPELQKIIQDIRTQVGKDWKEFLKKISTASPSELNVIFDSNFDTEDKGELIRITDDPNAPAVSVKEENLLQGYFDYKKLVTTLRGRYTDFKLNYRFYGIKRNLEADSHLCIIRYLDPDNPKSQTKRFFHPDIIKKFDKHYHLK